VKAIHICMYHAVHLYCFSWPLGSVLKDCDVSHAQELVNSLQVLQVVAPAMHCSMHLQVNLLFCLLFWFLANNVELLLW